MSEDKKTFVSNYISAYEKMRDKLHFPVKTPIDDLICPICGGKYKRRDKSKHCKRKKHRQLLPLVLEGKLMPTIAWEEVEEYEEELE